MIRYLEEITIQSLLYFLYNDEPLYLKRLEFSEFTTLISEIYDRNFGDYFYFTLDQSAIKNFVENKAPSYLLPWLTL
jgi:hypothetical protein